MEPYGNRRRLMIGLPVTFARNAKWWYSTFHNVTAVVGAGVLSLPHGMAKLGCICSGFFFIIMQIMVHEYTFYNSSCSVMISVLDLDLLSTGSWSGCTGHIMGGDIVHLWKIVEIHEMVPGRRFDRYHELGEDW